MSNRTTLKQMTICRLNTVARNECIITTNLNTSFQDWIWLITGIQQWVTKAKATATMQAFDVDLKAGTLENLNILE